MKKRRQFFNHNLLTLAFWHGYKEVQKMKTQKKWGVALLSALVLIPIFLFTGNVQPDVGSPESSKAVFFVS
jgi:hypothetical protein